MKRLNIIWFLLTGLSAVAADESGTNVFKEEDFVAEVLRRNPEVKFYEAEIAAARGERRAAGTFANPELNGDVGHKRASDAAGTLAGEGVAWSVGLSQSFEWPGRLGLRKAIANRQISMAELGLEKFKASLAARARTSGVRKRRRARKGGSCEEVAAGCRRCVTWWCSSGSDTAAGDTHPGSECVDRRAQSRRSSPGSAVGEP